MHTEYDVEQDCDHNDEEGNLKGEDAKVAACLHIYSHVTLGESRRIRERRITRPEDRHEFAHVATGPAVRGESLDPRTCG